MPLPEPCTKGVQCLNWYTAYQQKDDSRPDGGCLRCSHRRLRLSHPTSHGETAIPIAHEPPLQIRGLDRADAKLVLHSGVHQPRRLHPLLQVHVRQCPCPEHVGADTDDHPRTHHGVYRGRGVVHQRVEQRPHLKHDQPGGRCRVEPRLHRLRCRGPTRLFWYGGVIEPMVGRESIIRRLYIQPTQVSKPQWCTNFSYGFGFFWYTSLVTHARSPQGSASVPPSVEG